MWGTVPAVGCARRARVATMGLIAVATTAGAGVLAGCSSNGDAPVAAEPTGWIAADLESSPDGLVRGDVDEYSSDGRRIGYRAIDRGKYGDDGSQVQITTRVPMVWSVAAMVDAYDSIPDDRRDGIDVDAEVAGHRAIVVPATDDGRQFGWEVIWEPAPGVQVQVTDTRHDAEFRPTATRESALGLAESVHGMDRATWDGLLAESLAASPYATPGPAVTRPVATGEVDGRPWSLESIEPSGETSAPKMCFRLTYAATDTGPNCAPERVVLAGKGFVILRTGASAEAPLLEPGPGSSFDPVRPDVYAFGPDPVWHAALAVLPDGACAVEYRRPFSSAEESKAPLNLLPGDPGAAECAAR